MNASFDTLLTNGSSLTDKAVGPSIHSDNHSLNNIRKQALTDSNSAVEAAAKEFEAFFMNEMLKSMRQASEVIGDDSMFSSSEEKMFVGMLDEQMSVDLSQQGTLGIAKMMLRELNPEQNQQSTSFVKRMPENFTINNSPIDRQNTINNITHNISPIKLTSNNGVNESNEIKINTLKSNKANPLITEVVVSEVIVPDVMPAKKSLFASATEFVKQLMPIAKKSADKIGVDPKILIAQAALETGWGEHIIHNEKGLPSFNLFGIKNSESWKGESVKINTLEVESGEFVKRKESFRSYENFEKSFEDIVNFISENPRYKEAMEVVSDAKKFIQSVQDAGYATDPDYANKIMSIFNRDTLMDSSYVK